MLFKTNDSNIIPPGTEISYVITFDDFKVWITVLLIQQTRIELLPSRLLTQDGTEPLGIFISSHMH